jgi:hypothetical protein
MIRTDTDEFSPAQLRQDELEARAEFIMTRMDELRRTGYTREGALKEATEEWEGEAE